MRGLVLSGANNLFLVECEDGARRLCAIKGKRVESQRGRYNAIACGDWTEIEPDAHSADRGMISGLEVRRNEFGRWNEKGKADQAVAANLDMVVCVTSPSSPPFRPRFIDRIAIQAEYASIPLLVLLNKRDLGVGEAVLERLAVYEGIGYGVLSCSAASGEGLEALEERIEGRIVAFVGQSGVGKSSVLNALEPGIERKVGEISEKFKRGRHTTTAAVMARRAGGRGWIIDTPGFRRMALRGFDAASLSACFPEISSLLGSCEYSGRCTHSGEPGCAVEAAAREGRMHPDRYESYLRILEESTAGDGYARKAGRPRKVYDDE